MDKEGVPPGTLSRVIEGTEEDRTSEGSHGGREADATTVIGTSFLSTTDP